MLERFKGPDVPARSVMLLEGVWERGEVGERRKERRRVVVVYVCMCNIMCGVGLCDVSIYMLYVYLACAYLQTMHDDCVL